jgi:hypothetical protein
MENFIPHRLTGIAYVLFGLAFIIGAFMLAYSAYQDGYKDFWSEFLMVFSFGLLPILAGIAIAKMNKIVMVIALFLLPLLWFSLGLIFFWGAQSTDSHVALFIINAPVILFILTCWSLITMLLKYRKES